MSLPTSAPPLRHWAPGLLKRGLMVLEDWGLPTLTFATLTCFALAVLDRLADAAGSSSWSMTLLETATAQSNDEGVWNKLWHVFFALTVGWAGIRAYMATVGFQLDGWFVRMLCRDHLVIMAGDGSAPDVGVRDSSPVPLSRALSGRAQLAIELAESSAHRHGVVLCLPGIGEQTRRRLWQAGVHVLQHGLMGPEVLHTARIGRARWMVAMRDSFEENVVLTQAALTWGSPQLAFRVMVPHGPRGATTTLDAYFGSEPLHRIRSFNDAELVARHLLKRFPPDAPVAAAVDCRVHLLLVGLGTVGQAVLERVAHLGHYGSGLRPRVSVVDEPDGGNWQSLQTRMPLLDRLLGVQLLPGGLAALQPEALRSWLRAAEPVTMVYVCTKDEVFNLRAARVLLQVWPDAGGPKIVVLDPPGGGVLSGLKEEFDAQAATRGRVEVFSLAGDRGERNGRGPAPLWGSLVEDLDDGIAIALHDDYQQRAVTEPSQRRPWQALPEADRDSNRWAGDHFEIKLRAIGRELVSPSAASGDHALNEHQLERLARMEHARWSGEKALQGGHLGHDPSRGDRLTLVPFAYLSRREADKDRHQVEGLVEHLAQRPSVAQRRVLVATAGMQAHTWARIEAGADELAAMAHRVWHRYPAWEASDAAPTAPVLLHGNGMLARHFLCRLAADLPAGAPPPAVQWVVPDAGARRAEILSQAPYWSRALDWALQEQVVEPALGALQALPATSATSALPPILPRCIYLLPDPGESLPGVIDTLGAALRTAAAAGQATAMDIVAVCWEQPPCAPVRAGCFGDARLHWLAAREPWNAEA
jgi:hypothetical protein